MKELCAKFVKLDFTNDISIMFEKEKWVDVIVRRIDGFVGMIFEVVKFSV